MDIEFTRNGKDPLVYKDVYIRFGKNESGISCFYICSKKELGKPIEIDVNSGLLEMIGFDDYQTTLLDVWYEFYDEFKKFLKMVASAAQYKWHKITHRRFIR